MATALRAAEVEAVFRAHDEMTDKMKEISDAAQSTGLSLKSAAETALGFAAGMVGLQSAGAVFDFVKASTIGINDAIAVSTIRFQAMGMTATQAQKHVSDLYTFANRTPFSSDQIVNASRNLRLMGGASLDTKKNLQLLVDAAAATGMSVDGLSTMFGRMYSSLKNGLPISRYLLTLQRSGVVTGATVAKIRELEKAGASSSKIWDVLTRDVSRFAGTGDKLAGTWGALTQVIHSSLEELSAKAFKPFFELAQKGLVNLRDWLLSAKVEEWATRLSTLMVKAAAIAGRALAGLQPILRELQGWFEDVVNTAGPILQMFLGVVGDVVGGIMGFLERLIRAVKTVADDIWKKIQELAGKLEPALAPVKDAIKEWTDKLTDVMPFLRDTKDKGNELVPVVWALVAAYAAFNATLTVVKVLEYADALAKLAANTDLLAATKALLAGNIFSIIAVAIAALAAAFVYLYINNKQFADFVNGAASTAWEFLKEAAKTLGEYLTPLVDAFSTFVGSLRSTGDPLTALGVAIEQLTGGAISAKAVWDLLAPTFTMLGNAIMTGIAFALPYLKMVWDDVSKAMADAGEKLRPMFDRLGVAFHKMKPLLDLLVIVFGILAVVVMAILAGVFGALINFLDAALPAAIQVAVDIIQIIVDAFTLIGDVVADLWTILDDIFHGRWGKLWGDVGKLFMDWTQDILVLLGHLAIGIWDLVKGIVVTVLETFIGLVEGVVGFFQWLFDQLVGHSIIPDMINAIVAWFKALPGKIMAVLVGIGTWLLQKGKDLIQGLWDGIIFLFGLQKKGAGTVAGWLADIGMKVITAMGKVDRILWGIGISIVQGLWDGMSHQWSQIASWLAGLAEWIQQHKGPLSKDQTLLYKNGKALMDGLHQGMLDGWDDIQRSIAAMNADLPTIGGGGMVYAGAGLMTPGMLGAAGTQSATATTDHMEEAVQLLRQLLTSSKQTTTVLHDINKDQPSPGPAAVRKNG